MSKKILVVDDERDIVDLIRYNLTREGYDVLAAFNGEDALARTRSLPDLVILDVMMPGLDGFEVCKRMKAEQATSHIPVVFLTASSSEVDEVLGLELGADDYIQKPISPRKLVARVKAVLRRAEQPADAPAGAGAISTGPLRIDREKRTVRVRDQELFLPRKEFDLLAFLAGHRGKVYSREALLAQIWGSEVYVIDRTVDVHIRRIREKLGDDAGMIETVKGVGYRFREEETD